ncbi:MAG: hypothetical protein KA783_11360 [Chitinophagales bacterium]|jgi:hypothetical protein|nr:hypothetical protein [Sphingobacteriales bacterium]MBP6664551.1 hypothetical protein [Chitinophagales bacterium]MBP7535037.1 hypothetical protein [Chitinophagales bacterium]
MKLNNIFLIFLLSLLSTTSVFAQSVYQQSKNSPIGYKSRIDMYDDVTTFFIMPNDDVMLEDGKGGFTLVGYKEPRPKGRTDVLFIFTILQPPITYGVDKSGHVWQSDGNFRQIVGNANRAGLIERMYKTN